MQTQPPRLLGWQIVLRLGLLVVSGIALSGIAGIAQASSVFTIGARSFSASRPGCPPPQDLFTTVHHRANRRVGMSSSFDGARCAQRQPHGGLGFHPERPTDSKNA